MLATNFLLLPSLATLLKDNNILCTRSLGLTKGLLYNVRGNSMMLV